MKYFEVDFPHEWSICIKGTRLPSASEANEFLKKDITKYGEIKDIRPIKVSDAKLFYDFDNEPNWPVFGI